jgi:hypothetical protein
VRRPNWPFAGYIVGCGGLGVSLGASLGAAGGLVGAEVVGVYDVSLHELQLLQLLPHELTLVHELQLLQASHEDASPQELQPELQIERLPQHAGSAQQWRRCRRLADAESAMTSHTVDNTTRHMTIRRMILPPKKTGDTLATRLTDQRGPRE